MPIADLLIRAETPDDAAAINAITTAAFREVPHSGHTEQFIVAALRAAGQLSVSLVAEADGRLCGHVALSPVHIEDGSPAWFGLGPVSVLPALQRRGIGQQLIGTALQALRDRAAGGCVVLGNPAYYGRFGFRSVPGLVLPGVPAEYFQAMAFGPRMAQGRVGYHAAFDARA